MAGLVVFPSVEAGRQVVAPPEVFILGLGGFYFFIFPISVPHGRRAGWLVCLLPKAYYAYLTCHALPRPLSAQSQIASANMSCHVF